MHVQRAHVSKRKTRFVVLIDKMRKTDEELKASVLSPDGPESDDGLSGLRESAVLQR